MITPRFRLLQNDNTVTIVIRAPYCNLRELDVQVDDEIFLFYCSPYHLRLHLPGRLVDNDDNTTSGDFNSDTGEFTFNYNKAIPGEHFDDLEMITKLLCRKIDIDNNGDKIVLLTNDNELPSMIDGNSEDDGNDEFGFAMKGKRNFNGISMEFNEVLEIDPRIVPLLERRKLRLQHEQNKFNIDHYICDFIENDEIIEIINLESPLSDLLLLHKKIEFTDKELDFLKDLKNIDYHLNEKQLRYSFYGLIDILYAYCYDRRTTFFDGTSESCWNITKLSATLCWLDGYQDLKEILICCFRRSLIYPLYRNFNLNLQIFKDLKQLVKMDEKYLIKCLIEIHGIFINSQYCCYILNNLFIKDYIIFIMKWEKSKWLEIVEKLDNITIDKKDLGLNLIEIEDGLYENQLKQMNNLTIKDDDSDDDED